MSIPPDLTRLLTRCATIFVILSLPVIVYFYGFSPGIYRWFGIVAIILALRWLLSRVLPALLSSILKRTAGQVIASDVEIAYILTPEGIYSSNTDAPDHLAPKLIVGWADVIRVEETDADIWLSTSLPGQIDSASFHGWKSTESSRSQKYIRFTKEAFVPIVESRRFMDSVRTHVPPE